MSQRPGRFRKKTRKKLRKKPRERGKVSITKMLQEFNLGEKVRIIHEPSVHEGMPHPRFKNKVGEIIGKQGKVYVVQIKDGRKSKKLLAHPVHLVRING